MFNNITFFLNFIYKLNESYIDSYMAKNLYYLSSMEESRYNSETYENGRTYRYFVLMPYYELSKSFIVIGQGEFQKIALLLIYGIFAVKIYVFAERA